MKSSSAKNTPASSTLLRIALALVALTSTLATVAPACTSTKSGGGSGDSCNEDDFCDEEEDCDCVDCAGTAVCGSPGCQDDGVCAISESCDCADCATTPACTGAGGSGATSSNATGTSTNSTSNSTTNSTSNSTTNSTASTTSGGGNFMCADVSDPACGASDPASCLCLGCDLAVCDDGNGNYNDCVCANCAADPFCSDPANCSDDGVCDPGLEGCVCADCAGHPLCP